MKNRELLALAFNSLRHRSIRSWLAILGIVIGVASIISFMSISYGMSDQIKSQLSGLGANIITITSGGMSSQRMGMGPPMMEGFGGSSSTTKEAKITFSEADSLRSVTGVDKLDARVQSRATVSYNNRNSSLSVIGTEASAFPDSTGIKIMLGRGLEASDRYSAVLGFTVANTTFSKGAVEDILSKQIRINGVSFRVVGILNQSGATFSGPDNLIFIPQRTAKSLFDQEESVSSIVVVALQGSNPDTVAAALAKKLRELHGVSETNQDFQVTTATTMQSAISSMSSTLGIFLGAIASISLLVGGIGVANAMFTSVLEQTKYIGILKSIGTKSNDVMKLFLFEASLVGLVGGVLGVILSFFGSSLLGGFGLPSKITPDLILLGMGFSILIGAVSGVVPARNAASVAPVEALRYE
ncbi:MAG: ABC transporter permease [Candidatus Micrarchaeota archaeon]|nr:ABC transporter permease [Candidatus Micrarchaeota archaeon]